jgi:hypothetical protein
MRFVSEIGLDRNPLNLEKPPGGVSKVPRTGLEGPGLQLAEWDKLGLEGMSEPAALQPARQLRCG